MVADSVRGACSESDLPRLYVVSYIGCRLANSRWKSLWRSRSPRTRSPNVLLKYTFQMWFMASPLHSSPNASEVFYKRCLWDPFGRHVCKYSLMTTFQPQGLTFQHISPPGFPFNYLRHRLSCTRNSWSHRYKIALQAKISVTLILLRHFKWLLQTYHSKTAAPNSPLKNIITRFNNAKNQKQERKMNYLPRLLIKPLLTRGNPLTQICVRIEEKTRLLESDIELLGAISGSRDHLIEAMFCCHK